jgi:carboxyl-terminal processing protease
MDKEVAMRKSYLIVAAIVVAGSAAALPFALASHDVAALSKQDLALIGGVMQLVQRDYVHPIDGDQLTDDALKGLLSHLDPHSSYMTESEYRQSMQDMNGKFGGIGLEISDHNGVPTVISPIDGTPAAQGGLQPGDVIAAIDGQSTHGEDLMKVVTEIRGDPGTSVKLAVIRGTNAPFDVRVTRKVIRVHSVKSKLEPDDIGYLRISQFGSNTPDELKQAVTTLKANAGGKLRGLVLDLRDDPGGLLSSAVAVSGDFLDGGTIVSIRGRHGGDNKQFDAPANGELLADAPMVILVNGASASASEIVAGALQDRHRATVMGTQSFGKGSVQTIIAIKGHGALRLTTALYYTPSGRSIQDDGITPDKVVEAPKDQQVDTAFIWRESQMHGALNNPGLLTKGKEGTANASSQDYSPPIREQLIGTAQDAQLAAALGFLKPPAGASSSRSSGPT